MPTFPCRLGRRTWTSCLRHGRESLQRVGSSVWLAFSAAAVWRLIFSLAICAFAPWGDFDFSFGTPNTDCTDCRSSRRFLNLRQALFQPGRSLLSLRNPFLQVLEKAYNGRRIADVAEW